MAKRNSIARGKGLPPPYGRQHGLVLLNGLAEQPETWFRNQRYWRRHFDVSMPNLFAYDGVVLHQRLEAGLPITVDFLVGQLHRHLEEFVQTPPYHLVANSMGGKIAIEYAARYPEQVASMVLICPSGLSAGEELPIVDGVRRFGVGSIIESVFFNPRCIEPALVDFYTRQSRNRRWRTGFANTIRGTKNHCVRDRLVDVKQPTLLISGREDRIVKCEEVRAAAGILPHGQFLMIPRCGHAAQIEKDRLINRIVVRYLTGRMPAPRNVEQGSAAGLPRA
ncbi:MAG TPA: alpha/beta hydrolase [Gemmataceae bacterium]|jgi:pimeloyl-ACP methyl ester carboxylesterase